MVVRRGSAIVSSYYSRCICKLAHVSPIKFVGRKARRATSVFHSSVNGLIVFTAGAGSTGCQSLRTQTSKNSSSLSKGTSVFTDGSESSGNYSCGEKDNASGDAVFIDGSGSAGIGGSSS